MTCDNSQGLKPFVNRQSKIVNPFSLSGREFFPFSGSRHNGA